MFPWTAQRRCGPIGVDIGARSVKLVQFQQDGREIVDAVRWDLPGGEAPDLPPEQRWERVREALRRAREGRRLRGSDAVLCLSDRELFLQNVRVPSVNGVAAERAVQQEAAGRLPFPIAETELRFVDAAEIRQGENLLREVIVLACHRPNLEPLLAAAEGAGLRPVAIDAEPLALLRAACQQQRRDEDRAGRSLYVHVGHGRSAALIAEGERLLFVKYVPLGGRHFDEAVSQRLKLGLAEAAALRRRSGDRRGDQQDPEVAGGIQEAIRPLLEKLCGELAMCVRYHSVTFRGQPLVRLVLGGGEASAPLLDVLANRLHLRGELSDPFRGLSSPAPNGRKGQWDVAAGLALRETT